MSSSRSRKRHRFTSPEERLASALSQPPEERSIEVLVEEALSTSEAKGMRLGMRVENSHLDVSDDGPRAHKEAAIADAVRQALQERQDEARWRAQMLAADSDDDENQDGTAKGICGRLIARKKDLRAISEDACMRAAVLAGRACEACITEAMLTKVLEGWRGPPPPPGLKSTGGMAPRAPGPPFPWEWASLSDGTYLRTTWSCREYSTMRMALEEQASRNGLHIDWDFGHKLLAMRAFRSGWATTAAAVAAAKLRCTPPELYGGTRPGSTAPRRGDLLPTPQMLACREELRWSESQGCFCRESEALPGSPVRCGGWQC